MRSRLIHPKHTPSFSVQEADEILRWFLGCCAAGVVIAVAVNAAGGM